MSWRLLRESAHFRAECYSAGGTGAWIFRGEIIVDEDLVVIGSGIREIIGRGGSAGVVSAVRVRPPAELVIALARDAESETR